MNPTHELDEDDLAVRGALTRLIAEEGRCPSDAQLSAASGVAAAELPKHLRRLADAHLLALHPGGSRPWVVHPFALAPGACHVQTATHSYWANCLYCAFGIATGSNQAATITTRYGGEAETVRYRVSGAASITAPTCSTCPLRRRSGGTMWCSHAQPFSRSSIATMLSPGVNGMGCRLAQR